jgi:prophage regulatory protein
MTKPLKRATAMRVGSVSDNSDARQRVLSTLLDLQTEAVALYGRIQADTLKLGQLHGRMLVMLDELSNLPVVAPESPRRQPLAAFLRLSAVIMRVGLSRSAIWRMVKEDNFPRPRRLSTRAVGWDANEIETWLGQRKSL